MKNRFRVQLLGIGLILILLISSVPPIQAEAFGLNQVDSMIQDIVTWKLEKEGAESLQTLISQHLVPQAGKGIADWYILAIRKYTDSKEFQNPLDYSAYVQALYQYYAEAGQTLSATETLRIALTLSAIEGDAQKLQELTADCIGKQGITSYLYGLLLLNSRNYTFPSIEPETILQEILQLKCPDNGWALQGDRSDPDITAMVLQALAPYQDRPQIQEAIQAALSRLSQLQLSQGDYSSWGTRNAETTAQVLLSLSCLGLDGIQDSRFIKEGNTLPDGLLLYRLPDGSFRHALEGGSSDMATVQVFCALLAFQRNARQEASFFQFQQELGSEQTESGPTTPRQSPGISETAELKHITGYQQPGMIVMLVSAVLLVFVLYLRKKCTKGRLLVIAGITAAAIFLLFTVRIQIPDTAPEPWATGKLAATLSIRCDSILEKTPGSHIPKDGVFLAETEVPVQEGDSVLDLLKRILQKEKIPAEYGANGYIKGIGNLYEMQFGVLSGWLYRVNGAFASGSAEDYLVSAGDRIEWIYSCDGGKDIE